MGKTYKTKSEALANVVDIAVNCVEEIWPEGFNQHQKDHFISVYLDFKDKALNPEPPFKNLKSLKYLEQAVLTYFQEGEGRTVELFWKKVRETQLPYKRKNPLLKILKRKMISNDIEYNYVTDSIVVLEQEGTITGEQALALGNMIGEYEMRKK